MYLFIYTLYIHIYAMFICTCTIIEYPQNIVIKENYYVNMWLLYLYVLLIWSHVLLVMNDSQSRLKFSIGLSKMKNIVIWKKFVCVRVCMHECMHMYAHTCVCMCIAYMCAYKLIGPEGEWRDQPVIYSAEIISPCESWGDLWSRSGREFPHTERC